MKTIKFSLLIALALSFGMTSCNSSPMKIIGGETPVEPSAINKWILEQMTANYYWQAEMPAKPNMTASPVDLFSSLKSSKDNYSQIYNKNDISTEVGVELGFEYAINKYSDNKTYYVVLYVKPGTDAEGDPTEPTLSRGNIISRVNNIEVTEANAATLLAAEAKKANSITFSILTPQMTIFQVIVKTVPQTSYNENPVFYSGVYKNKNNEAENIGYLVYNIFRSDNRDGSQVYNRALMTKLAAFAADPTIKYLVLDLRYNAGGDLNAATYLASAIVNARKVEDSFIVYQRNPVLGSDSKKMVDKIENTDINIPRLGDQLKKVYILTGNDTAGASETFIHCMRAYLGAKIEVIGINTKKGANYLIASYSDAANTANPYILNVFYAYLANKNNDANYGNGGVINVDIVHDEILNSTHQLRLKELGNVDETLFKVALDRISGVRSLSAFTEGSSTVLGSSIQSKPWANQNIDEDINH